MLDLLRTRLQVRRVLTSGSVAETYPDLDSDLEQYVDSVAAEQAAQSRYLSLQDVLV